jgi:hypothetical protein
MAKMNLTMDGKTYKVCEAHTAKMYSGPKFSSPDLDEMFNCVDCRCLGECPSNEDLIADTAQDPDADLDDRVTAAKIS